MGAGETAIRIARDFLPEVARGAYGEIARELAVSTARVRKCGGDSSAASALHPAPSSIPARRRPRSSPMFTPGPTGGRVRILANREILPSLRLSKLYQQMAETRSKSAPGDATTATGAAVDPEASRYIKEKIQEASRLIRDIDQRRVTVTRVARAIAEAQPEFLHQGAGAPAAAGPGGDRRAPGSASVDGQPRHTGQVHEHALRRL